MDSSRKWTIPPLTPNYPERPLSIRQAAHRIVYGSPQGENMKFVPEHHDVETHKFSGSTCDHHKGAPLTWNGHLCEGANLTGAIGENFCLWTKCEEHDVPANAAEVGSIDDISCLKCMDRLQGRTP